MTKKCLAALIVLMILGGSVGAQTSQQSSQPREESKRWRTIGTVAGAGGGFLLGMAIGFGAYDDAINSERKITTVAVVSAAAGALGGYFIGRKIDKGKTDTVWRMDRLDRSLLLAEQLPPPHLMLRESQY